MARSTLFSVFVGLVLTGCTATPLRHTVPECPGLCSEGSGYAPVAQLFVTVQTEGDSMSIRVDSGHLGVPDLRPGAPGPVLMSKLSLRAFIGVSRDLRHSQSGARARSDLASGEHAWRVLAESPSRPLADSLHYGEVRPIAPSRWRLALPSAGFGSEAWLGFAITGDAIDPRAESRERGILKGGVRVYVCDPRNLAGEPDSLRAVRLAERYTGTC
jgi:hypothetical protein